MGVKLINKITLYQVHLTFCESLKSDQVVSSTPHHRGSQKSDKVVSSTPHHRGSQKSDQVHLIIDESQKSDKVVSSTPHHRWESN